MQTRLRRRRRRANRDAGDAGTPGRLALAALVVALACSLAAVPAAGHPPAPSAVPATGTGPSNATDDGGNRSGTTVPPPVGPVAGPNLSIVTRNGVPDGHPAVARTDDGYVAVWQRLPADNAQKAGKDIYYATYEDGEWSSPRAVTDDVRDEYQPRIAYDASTGRAVAVWTRVDADFRGESPDLQEVLAAQEVVYATYEDGEWSSPERLTDDDAADAAPKVAANDGQFLVAWTFDRDADPQSAGDAGIRHALITRSGAGEVRKLGFASAPRVVAPGPDDGFRMGFFTPDAGKVGEKNGTMFVMAGRRQFEETFRRSVSSFRGMGLQGDAIAWAATVDGQSRILYTEGEKVRPVETTVGTQSIVDVSLHSARGSPLLVYRGAPPNASGRQLTYLFRHRGEWVYERSLRTDADDLLAYSRTVVATREGDFAAVMAAHEAGKPQQNDDLFALVHEFRADLAVEAQLPEDARNRSAGDSVTVSYSLRNLGDVPTGQGFEVQLLGDGEVLASKSYDEMGIGAARNDSLTAALPESGELVLRVDPGNAVPEITTENNRVSLQFGRRDVGVFGRRVVRNGSQLTVVATVGNEGSVPLDRVEVGLGSPEGGALDRTTVEDLKPGERREVRLRTTVSAARNTNATSVVAATRGDVAPVNNQVGVALLRPSVVLYERQVSFEDTTDGLLAKVTVFNEGSDEAQFRLVAIGPDGGTIDAINGTVPAVTTPDGVASTVASVRLPPSVSGRRVTLVAEVPADPDSEDNAVEVQVPSLPSIDANPPKIETFEATANGSTVRVRITADERLDRGSIRVNLSGPASTTLSGEDFDPRGRNYTYVATTTLSKPGEYTASLANAADPAGNAVESAESVSVRVEGRSTGNASDGGDDESGGGGGLPLVPIVGVVVLLAVIGVAYRQVS